MHYKYRLLVICVLMVLFFAGVVQLFLLRFKAGDVYPPYSSLRSDPLGSKVFYASLEQIDALQVRRNYSKLTDLPAGNGATLFFLGTELGQLVNAPESFFKEMDRWVATGGRVVVVLRTSEEKKDKKKRSKKKPLHEQESSPLDDERTFDEEESNSSNNSSNSEENHRTPTGPNGLRKPASKPGYSPLREQWGVTIGSMHNKVDFANGIPAIPSEDLPFGKVNWHSRLYVVSMTSNWQPIMTVTDQPVMIERRLRGGSIVLATDSYFISNEALSLSRHPSLLIWLIDGRSKIIFDERHLGVAQSPGLAKLVRRYGFQWFAISAVMLMALFIWKNARPFIPPPTQEDQDQSFDYASEKDSYQGMISLLRRNLPAGRILTVCIAEWKKTNEKNRMIPKSKIKAVEAFLEKWEKTGRADQDQVAGYRKLSKLLMGGKKPNA